VRAHERFSIELELNVLISVLVAPLEVDRLSDFKGLLSVLREHFLDHVHEAQLLELLRRVERRVKLPNVLGVEYLQREYFLI
jgi:hypothetical protein